MSDAEVLAELEPALAPGLVVDGKYELVQELGRGGYGAVWRARDRALQGDVAIKVLVSRLGSPEVVQRFAREGEALHRLQVPGVVRVRAAGEASGLRYLVMDLVEGVPLAAWLAGVPALPDRIQVALELSRAVSAMHAAGVIHRDIKASNVIMTANGPVLVDLGLAKLVGRAQITRVGAGGGTPGAAAPEQWGALESATAAADVYALGALLYRMLTDQEAFAAPAEVAPDIAAAAVIVDQHQQPAPRVGSKVTGVPEALDGLVAAMLERDPARRPTMRQVIDTIDGVRETATAPTQVRPGAGEAPRWRWPAVGALAAVIVVVVGALALPRRSDPDLRPASRAALAVQEAGHSEEVPLEGEAGVVVARGLRIEHRARAAGAAVRVEGDPAWQVTTASASARLVSGSRRLSVRWLPADAAAERR